MELIIYRKYYPTGTNGELYTSEVLVCCTIELPWLCNTPQQSCIPEGRYRLLKRTTDERGEHLVLRDVPGRSGILIHPANDALRELKGCIAPVTYIDGAGRGSFSRVAMKLLLGVVDEAMERGEKVFLTIKKKWS